MNLDLTTDLSTVTDERELKAMAYDTIAIKEQSEHRLQAINQRIREVLGHVPPAAPDDASTEDKDAGTPPATPEQ